MAVSTSKSRNIFKLIGPLVSFLMVFSLSACLPIVSRELNFTVGKDEKVEMEMVMTISGEQSANINSMLSLYLNEPLEQIKSEGLTADWEILDTNRDGNTPVRITINGQGFNHFNNSEIIDEDVFTVENIDGKSVVHFQLDSGSLSGNTYPTTVTLKSGKIFSSNGTKKNNQTVVWENPQEDLEAVFSETPDANFALLLAVGGAGIIILIFIKSNSKLSQKKPVQYFDNEAKLLFCHACGKSIPPSAPFCPFCGKKQ